MVKNFFDEDLETGRELMSEGERGREEAAVRGVEATESRFVRQKQAVAENVAVATNEIERLRKRQEELEREKAELEAVSRKQEEYERGRHDIIEKLERSIVLIEKEEIQAARLAEVLSTTRARFQETLDGIKQIDPESWSETEFKNELNKALALLEDARVVYKKGIAKVEATRWPEGETAGALVARLERAPGEMIPLDSFGFWLRAGLALAIPLAGLALLVVTVYAVLSR